MKTACIYHSIDLDGWMSAAIVKHWVNQQSDLTSLDFIGYNYGHSIPDLTDYDKVIMCDISFPAEEMYKLYDKLTWIDHHISDINSVDYTITGLRDIKFAACELTWKYFFPNDKMPEIVRLLGRYDCFGHKDTDEEQKVLEFQYGAREVISNYESAYRYLLREFQDVSEDSTFTVDNIYKKGQAIYSYLCTEAKQAYKNGFEIKFEVSSNETHSVLKGYNVYSADVNKYKFICINKERFNPINFGINYHKDDYDGAACFHFDGKEWCFSLYNDNEKVNCSEIAKQFGGGGHAGAAGFRVKDINMIIS